MRGSSVPNMYDALNMEAFTNSEWIGAGLAQIDELKETQAALWPGCRAGCPPSSMSALASGWITGLSSSSAGER